MPPSRLPTVCNPKASQSNIHHPLSSSQSSHNGVCSPSGQENATGCEDPLTEEKNYCHFSRNFNESGFDENDFCRRLGTEALSTSFSEELKTSRNVMESTPLIERKAGCNDKYSELLQWLESGGANFPKLQLALYDSHNRGVHISSGSGGVRKDENIVEIPLQFLITGSLAAESTIGKEIQASEFQPVSSYPFIACFILQEKFLRKEESFWKPWLDVIPSMEEAKRTLPVCFEDDVLEQLRGTEAYRIAIHRRKRNRKEYDQLYQAVKTVRENFSYEQYVWARCVTTTRSYGINIGGVFNSAIVPFADMFNHSSKRETRWTYDNSKGTFIVSSLRDFDEFSPVHVFYGNKSNGRFMAHYGFHIPDNDKVVVTLSDNVNLTFASDWPFTSLLLPLRSRALCRRKLFRRVPVEDHSSLSTFVPTPTSESSMKSCTGFFSKKSINFKFRSRNKKNCPQEQSQSLSKPSERDCHCTCSLTFPKLCPSCSSQHFGELISGLNVLNEAEALVMLKKICEEQLSNYDSSYEEDVSLLETYELKRGLLNPNESQDLFNHYNLQILCIEARMREKMLFVDAIDFVKAMLPLLSLGSKQIQNIDLFQDPPTRYKRYFSEVLSHLLLKEESIMEG